MRNHSFLFTALFALAGLVGCSGDSASTDAYEAESVAAQRDSHPDYDQILGTWKIVSSEWDGEPNDRAVGNFYTFKGGRLTAWIKDVGDISMDYEMDATKQPKHLTASWGFPPDQKIHTAIYELDGDTLKLCYNERDRPTSFKTEAGSWWTSHVLKRTESME